LLKKHYSEEKSLGCTKSAVQPLKQKPHTSSPKQLFPGRAFSQPSSDAAYYLLVVDLDVHDFSFPELFQSRVGL
jgi:hypothetical protein